MTDDALGSIDEVRKRVQETEDKFGQLAAFVDDRVKRAPDNEDKLIRKTTESIEALGSLIKD